MKKITLAVLAFALGLFVLTLYIAKSAEAATPPATVPQGGTGWGAVTLGNILFGQGTSLPGSLRLGTSSGLTFSTTTGNLTFNYGSTTALSVSGLTSGNCVQAGTGGLLTTTGGACATAAAFPFTPTTNFGAAANSTSTPIWFTAGLQASSTSYFGPSGLGVSVDGTTGQLNTQNVVVATGKTIQFTGYSALPQLYAGDSTTGVHFDGPGITSFHGSGIQQGLLSSTGHWGFGATSSPYAKLAIQAYATESNTTLFAIASSTASATTTLFTISNIGSTTISRFGTCSGTSALTTDSSGTIVCGTGYGSGTVTSITAGTGLSGGTITNSGTVSLLSYLATSSAETSGRIPVWSSTSGTPATLGGGFSGYTLTSSLLSATNASTTNLTVGTYFQPPNQATNPTNTASGSLVVNTNGTASSSISIGDGTVANQIFATHSFSGVFGSSTLAYMGSFGAAGTTTLVIANPLHSSTLRSGFCQTDTGTVYINFGNGSATTTAVQCTAAGAAFTVASNNTWTGRQRVFLGIGTSASSPNIITVTADVEDSN